MNKKAIIFSFILLSLIMLVACDGTTTESTSTTPTTSTSTVQTITNTAKPLTDSTPSECQLIPVEDGWVPVWCDEFNYTGSVDSTKWNVVVAGGGFGNNELQYYTNKTDNIFVDGANLVITARKESYSSSNYTYNYTSAKIWTNGTFDWKYGKFEMRAKLPAGRGSWPAFWMMPSSSRYGGWPNSGEIDIMEHVGYDMNTVVGTIHTERFFGSNGRGSTTDSLINQGVVPSIDVANEFHTYGIVWDETSITWYFDGYEYNKESFNPYLSGSYNYDTTVDWPFDQYFYLILNLAIGGNWGGAQGVDDSIFPISYVIDYVRVYQQDYVYGDVLAPESVSNVRVVTKDTTSAYLVWNEAEDDKNIQKYFIYVNGSLSVKTSVPGVKLTGLKAGTDYIISIVAQDYAGNLSTSYQLSVTTKS